MGSRFAVSLITGLLTLEGSSGDGLELMRNIMKMFMDFYS